MSRVNAPLGRAVSPDLSRRAGIHLSKSPKTGVTWVRALPGE